LTARPRPTLLLSDILPLAMIQQEEELDEQIYNDS
jgi:hypothetical protein